MGGLICLTGLLTNFSTNWSVAVSHALHLVLTLSVFSFFIFLLPVFLYFHSCMHTHTHNQTYKCAHLCTRTSKHELPRIVETGIRFRLFTSFFPSNSETQFYTQLDLCSPFLMPILWCTLVFQSCIINVFRFLNTVWQAHDLGTADETQINKYRNNRTAHLTLRLPCVTEPSATALWGVWTAVWLSRWLITK